MPEVHSTAIVGPEVELAEDVIIGPWCMIQGRIRIGEGTRLRERVSLTGPMAIGRNNILYPNCCFGEPPQDRKYDPEQPGAGVVIGDHNVFREAVTIHRATGDRPTTVGNGNYMMNNSHIGHDSRMGDGCTLANVSQLAGHVEMANQVVMGGGAMVHQFCQVGRLAMVGGLTGAGLDVPPFCTTYGTRTVGSLNLVGLRRAGYREHIKPLKEAFRILFLEGHTNGRAADLIEQRLGDDPLCLEWVMFIRGSKRGIAKYQGSKHTTLKEEA